MQTLELKMLMYETSKCSFDALDSRAGSGSYIDGSSTANQRIESWWGILRKENADYWIQLFTTLKDDGEFDGNFLDKSLI